MLLIASEALRGAKSIRDVARDLSHKLVNAREGHLVPNALDEVDADLQPIEVLGVVEEMDLDRLDIISAEGGADADVGDTCEGLRRDESQDRVDTPTRHRKTGDRFEVRRVWTTGFGRAEGNGTFPPMRNASRRPSFITLLGITTRLPPPSPTMTATYCTPSML